MCSSLKLNSINFKFWDKYITLKYIIGGYFIILNELNYICYSFQTNTNYKAIFNEFKFVPGARINRI